MQATADPLPIDLALQGGGSHGAFTWGVLDRLLEEERLRIVAISGTSAGAMNAAVLADGWAEGGAAGARAALRAYWQEVSRAAALSPLQRSPLDRMMGRWTLDTSPAYIAMDLMSRLLSPYDLNPLAYNPLRKILVKCIDFERLARSPIKLFVTATSVRTGRGRIFRNADITADVLLASACLPTMFRGHRDRRRALLGWRICRQSDHHAAHTRKRCARHDPRADQPARTAGHAALRLRDSQSAERNLLQLAADERTPHDRAAASGGRSGQRRRRALGQHARAPGRHRCCSAKAAAPPTIF